MRTDDQVDLIEDDSCAEALRDARELHSHGLTS
jgi:hypothetical protein